MIPTDTIPLRVSVKGTTLQITCSGQEFHFSPHQAQRLADQMSHQASKSPETIRLLNTLRAFARSAITGIARVPRASEDVASEQSEPSLP